MDILSLADNFHKQCMVKLSKIRKLPNGKYRVLSEKGRNLGTYDSLSVAKKRLQQIEYFKHASKKIDFKDLDNFSLSAILRVLRNNGTAEQVRDFLEINKKEFDEAILKDVQKPEVVSLQNAIIEFSKKHPIDIDKGLIKNAMVMELGSADNVAEFLSLIVKNSYEKESHNFIKNYLCNQDRDYIKEVIVNISRKI